MPLAGVLEAGEKHLTSVEYFSRMIEQVIACNPASIHAKSSKKILRAFCFYFSILWKIKVISVFSQFSCCERSLNLFLSDRVALYELLEYPKEISLKYLSARLKCI